MSQRFEGRNLEEALQQAAQTFGVERWQLTYHVLLEKRGFLGGMKRIVVEADVNREAEAPVAAAAAVPGDLTPGMSGPSGAAAGRPPRVDRAPRQGGGGGRRDGGRSRAHGGRGGGRPDRADRPDRAGRGERADRARGTERPLRTRDSEAFPADVPEQGPESAGAKLVRDWVEGVIFLSRIDVITRTAENETQILVRVYGADSSKMTERHGELLDAIQVLANKALVGRKVEKEIELDCEDFKGRREEDLVRRAREIAERVRAGGDEEILPPMSPIERRIVHLALQDDADVTTDSRGEGFFKRVAIVPRPARDASESSSPQEP